MDNQVTLAVLKAAVQKMVDDRDWQQFHTPKDLAMNIAIEAGELMEHFVWNKPEGHMTTQQSRQEVASEVADIAIGLLNFCNQTSIDLSQAVQDKLRVIDQKYPISTSRGSSRKYDQL